MNNDVKKNAPIKRLARYFSIFTRQFFCNREYFYFWVIGILSHGFLIGSINPWVWAFIAAVDLFIGLVAMGTLIRPVDKAFENLGLDYSAGYGQPTWIVSGKYPVAQEIICVNAAGYGEKQFLEKIDLISSRLSQPIKTIRKPSANHPVIEVVLKRSATPSNLMYSELDFLDLKAGEFFVGKGDDGIEKLSLSKMIHMLIAGKTGGGKTYFARQFIVTISGHTRNAHICAIDMKGGGDYLAFEPLPNFELAVDYASASEMINGIIAQYELRKGILLKKKKALWSEIPARDLEALEELKGKPIGPLLLFVDELAELSKTAREKSANSELQEKLASLARLSRFTGIHLVLGTQRPDKDVINMQSKDNLATRICFSVPSVAASTLVVGDMTASTLGDHAGRAVYQLDKTKIVQTPFLDNIELTRLISQQAARLKLLGYTRSVLENKAPKSIAPKQGRILR